MVVNGRFQAAAYEIVSGIVGPDVNDSLSPGPIGALRSTVLIGVKESRAFSPLGCISQISRSPSLPLLVPKEIKEPFARNGISDGIVAKLRRRSTQHEAIQMLAPCEDPSVPPR